MITLLVVCIGSLVLVEFYGYWLHYIQHSDKIRWLSERHMNHHLNLETYPPGSNMRPSKTYRHHKTKSPILKYGAEWIVPGGTLICLTIFLEYYLLGLSIPQVTVSITLMILYAYVMFGWLHDTMHIKGHWLSKNRYTKKRYRQLLRLHDIHHHYIISRGVNKGLLPYNLGISTPMFDKVFGTYLSNMRGYSRSEILIGHKCGLRRYNIGDEDEDYKKAIEESNSGQNTF